MGETRQVREGPGGSAEQGEEPEGQIHLHGQPQWSHAGGEETQTMKHVWEDGENLSGGLCMVMSNAHNNEMTGNESIAS